MKSQFWNLLIKLGGILARTGWNISLAGDGLMDLGRRVGFGALARLAESEAK